MNPYTKGPVILVYSQGYPCGRIRIEGGPFSSDVTLLLEPHRIRLLIPSRYAH